MITEEVTRFFNQLYYNTQDQHANGEYFNFNIAVWERKEKLAQQLMIWIYLLDVVLSKMT